ncbi:MAG TPA: YciI family protein [Puia sp.]|nr:YciI family protein [Puia sp.]
MEKFMFIVREDLKWVNRMTAEEREAAIQEMVRWTQSIIESGNYLGGDPLFTTGRYVTHDQVLSDGPFIEAKEGVSGYMMLLAENINQAAAIAQSCPRVQRNEMVIEVRPVIIMDHA